jgi:vacuolar-type H+-ATPase subunit I/STV1
MPVKTKCIITIFIDKARSGNTPILSIFHESCWSVVEKELRELKELEKRLEDLDEHLERLLKTFTPIGIREELEAIRERRREIREAIRDKEQKVKKKIGDEGEI